jgi:hypothetical protein
MFSCSTPCSYPSTPCAARADADADAEPVVVEEQIVELMRLGVL